jgi:hypothetical protein
LARGSGSDNYRAGARKTFGDTVKVDEYSGAEPNDLPKVGDYVLLKTRAHEITKVRASPSRPGTVRYEGIIRRLSEVPATARTWESTPYIRDY